jgi:small subunit ribosomal protein S21
MDWIDGISYLSGLRRRAMGVGFAGSMLLGVGMVKLTVRERESIQEAVRRFRKLVERSGIKKEMRRREFFEKPSETKRRARLRAERRTKRNRLLGV